MADINLDAARQVALECDGLAANPNFTSNAIEIDVSKEESVKLAMAHVLRSSARIDYGVNCAGVSGNLSDIEMPYHYPPGSLDQAAA